MGQSIIKITDLTKRYGSLHAVDHLSLQVEEGEIFGLLGPNGAGKTTTILMLLGLTEPTSGQVNVCGVDSTRDPINVKTRVGYLPDDIGFYGDLTGFENLVYTARLNRMDVSTAEERAQALLKRVGLAASGSKKAGEYSRGMRQRLGLADVLIKNPDIIILDEPTLGIDPEGVREFLDLIRRLSRDDGMTVLLSSHHLHQVQQICDRVGLFVQGRLLAQGDIQTLSEQLFSSEPFQIQARVTSVPEDLIGRLERNEQVMRVGQENGALHITTSADITSRVAEMIIESGAGLEALTKKQYGLDEIYHRYFEEVSE